MSLSVAEICMSTRKHQILSPYFVKISAATGPAVNLPITVLTPKQAQELQVEFKKIAREARVRARISMQRLAVDDYNKVLHEVKARLRKAMPKAA